MIPTSVPADANLGPQLPSGSRLRLEPGRRVRPIHLANCTDVVLDGAGQVELWRSGITLENCRQVILRGLILRQSPASSVVVGAGCRDCVMESCTFAACGVIEGGVTLWLGPGTSGCTVSACTFDMLGAMGRRHLKRDQQ